MSAKFKVILAIFVIIVVLYVINYVISITNKISMQEKKRESFANMKVERFANPESTPPTHPSSSNYEINQMILQAIDIKISNKETQNAVMAKMFTNRDEYIGKTQQQLNDIATSLASENFDQPTNKIAPSQSPTSVAPPTPIAPLPQRPLQPTIQESKAPASNILIKNTNININDALDVRKLQTDIGNVSDALNDIKSYINTSSNVAKKETFVQNPTIRENFAQFDISGIENVKNFASYFAE